MFGVRFSYPNHPGPQIVWQWLAVLSDGSTAVSAEPVYPFTSVAAAAKYKKYCPAGASPIEVAKSPMEP